MNKINLQKELDEKLKEIEASGVIPKLLLHVCCAPCSSYCLEYLTRYFDITVFFYNPNIDDEAEYIKRRDEEKRLISQMDLSRKVSFIEGDYEKDEFHSLVKGHEADPEGAKRCSICFEMRLFKTAKTAKRLGFDFFTTTLSISPLKDSAKLAETAKEAEKKYGINSLPSDFKKKNGYKRSVELAKQYNLYRQNYCGCSYSKATRRSLTMQES